MTAIEKSYTEGLEGLETKAIKLRKGKIQAEYQGSLPTSETQKILQRNGLFKVKADQNVLQRILAGREIRLRVPDLRALMPKQIISRKLKFITTFPFYMA